MVRILGTVISIFCTATVLTGLFALTIVWGQGNLTRESISDVVSVLKGEPITVDEDSLKKKDEIPSYDDIVKARTSRILSISARETELAIFQQAIEDQANSILNERGELEGFRRKFRAELTQEQEKIVSESIEQARGILLKMDAESAVEKLDVMSIAEAVVLLKGMPEKDAARVLDQFRERITGKDPVERVKKAEEIYKAIYLGNPLITPVNNALQAMDEKVAGESKQR